jgi:bifunctional isochorismate lyase / aryl carrier protein
MGLPKIEPYELPGPAAIPGAHVGWRLEPHRAALLVHDMQRYFVRAFGAGSPAIEHAIANIQSLRRACAEANVPVVFTAQPGAQDPRDRGLQADFWGPGMGDGEEEVAIVEALTPALDDLVLTKWRYSAFERTALEPMLRARKRDQLIVTGVYAHIGCLLTSADAFMRDIQPFLVADAVADLSREKHEMAIGYVASHCGRVVNTEAVLGALGPGESSA